MRKFRIYETYRKDPSVFKSLKSTNFLFEEFLTTHEEKRTTIKVLISDTFVL